MRPITLVTCAAAAALAKPVDFVVIGAGTSGLVVANRLSEDPSVTVAVIEPGGDERDNPLVYTLDGWYQVQGTHVDWSYDLKGPPGPDGKPRKLAAGKGWGGTSLINGMTYIRGNTAEFDAWEDLGNPGWNWEALLPYYKRSELFTVPTEAQIAAGATYDEDYHGFEGHVRTGYPSTVKNTSFSPNVTQTWEGLGFEHNLDLNSGSVHGFSVSPSTVDPEQDIRWDSARANYYPIEQRRNIKIIQGTVKRITWAEKRGRPPKKGITANGVEYLTPDGKTKTLAVKKEVVVSAGALRTPLVLEGSGIGNPRILKSLGIDLVVDLPGVGENLIDQTNTVQAWIANFEASSTQFQAFVTAADLFGDDLPAVEASTRESLSSWSQAIVDASGEGALDPAAVETQLRLQHDLIFKKNVTLAEVISMGAANAGLGNGDTPVFGSAYWNLLPFSRGSVHLRSADAIDDPAIDPRYNLVDFDLQASVAAGKLVRKFWASQPIAGSVSGQVVPGPDVLPEDATEEEWESFHRAALSPNFHPLGTASMMARDLGGVVDPELRIYSTANVRVVDASVLPTQFSGHLTATLYAVAERASDFIRGKAKRN
ncbi:related to alcohol oxidase [Cephalotrichum gorgonifer]|uniref:Related to alcohol oxidase n=1 Tax=Cephalotrichum gorgonifer TaxID=2041049 RepID=A0AAE8N632_9PEZI|nr:related to alcohol oxidase [Cephalotrichum gorgonifer]